MLLVWSVLYTPYEKKKEIFLSVGVGPKISEYDQLAE